MKDELFDFYKSALQGVLTDPLCAEYRNEWRACGTDKERLMKLVMRQQSLPYFITHCYNGNGLSKEYILSNFGEYINGKRPIFDADGVKGYSYSIYVGFNSICKPDNDITAFMWCSCPTIEINKAKSPVLYVGANTELHLVCNGCNTPRIYLFDNSRLVIDDADETCSIIVYEYSDDVDVEVGKFCTTDNIKAFRKKLRI